MPEKPEQQHLGELAEGTPFRGSLIPGAFENSSLDELEGSPDKIVREWPVDVKNEDKSALDERMELFVKARAVFDGLRARYGLAVPEMDLVAGRNESENRRIFTVVDKIEGMNIGKENNLPAEMKEGVDELYATMVTYFTDTFREGGDFWTDFHNGQVVYGRKKDENKDRYYIVDVSPHLVTYHPTPVAPVERRDNYDFFTRLRYFYEDLEDSEKKFVPRAKFEKARGKLKELLALIPDDVKDRSQILYLDSKL